MALSLLSPSCHYDHSNWAVDEWLGLLDDPVLVNSTLNRLSNVSCQIAIEGTAMLGDSRYTEKGVDTMRRKCYKLINGVAKDGGLLTFSMVVHEVSSKSVEIIGGGEYPSC